MNNKHSRLWLTVASIAVTMTLSACNRVGTEGSEGIEMESTVKDGTTESEHPSETMNLNEQMSFSIHDLATRLSIEPDVITLTGAREVKWKSNALGCPKEGMNYAQALVPGMLIILSVDNQAYGYHAKIDGKPFYCPQERVERPAAIQKADVA